MGLQEQLFRDEQIAPLEGRLGEVEAVLSAVRDPAAGLGEQEALRQIGLIVTRGMPGDTYQKPLG